MAVSTAKFLQSLVPTAVFEAAEHAERGLHSKILDEYIVEVTLKIMTLLQKIFMLLALRPRRDSSIRVLNGMYCCIVPRAHEQKSNSAWSVPPYTGRDLLNRLN